MVANCIKIIYCSAWLLLCIHEGRVCVAILTLHVLHQILRHIQIIYGEINLSIQLTAAEHGITCM